MEIERKWMVKGWPETELPLLHEQSMRQGYISVRPTVRIREEARKGGPTQYILCFKSGTGLVRKEIEIEIEKDTFDQLEDLIGIPLIPKSRRLYQLPDGLRLEVNLVDEGMETEFMYAEIEYESEEQAMAWLPSTPWLAAYLNDDVTDDPGQTMGAYWVATRLNGKDNL
jgi:CYTH domain-containing protein